MSWVLVCDDQAHMARLIELTLVRHGWKVIACADGVAALEVLDREPPPQLIITDFQMPRLNGLGLIRYLRERPELSDVPIVLLTARGLELSEHKLQVTLGINTLLMKPFSPRQLVSLVNELTHRPVSPHRACAGVS
jgi:CheY-like chemotaxis protein